MELRGPVNGQSSNFGQESSRTRLSGQLSVVASNTASDDALYFASREHDDLRPRK
jgi:hypothetical protein